MTIRLSAAARNAAANAVVDLIDIGTTGRIEIRTGAKPATPDTAATGTLLATIDLVDPAFGNAAAGVATLLGTPYTAAFVAGGTAGWFRVYDGTAVTRLPVFDGDITATGGGGDMQLSNTTIASGVDLLITGTSYTQPL